ncbi:hypothetical protein TSOC_009312, partial [Tetrabaena socialis]
QARRAPPAPLPSRCPRRCATWCYGKAWSWGTQPTRCSASCRARRARGLSASSAMARWIERRTMSMPYCARCCRTCSLICMERDTAGSCARSRQWRVARVSFQSEAKAARESAKAQGQSRVSAQREGAEKGQKGST